MDLWSLIHEWRVRHSGKLEH